MRRRAVDALFAVSALALVVVGWKLYVEWWDVSRFLLPPPEDVWSALVALVREGDTWHHVGVTVREIVGGFGVALGFGVVTGVVLAEVRALERAVTPLLVTLQVVPKVAIIPILLLWFGFGAGSKLVIAAIFAYFPITAATVAGLKSVDLGHRELGRVLRARFDQRLVLIDLPSALPTILTGMEVGIVLATVGGVVAEYLAGGEGLGWMAVRALNQVRVDDLFAVIVLLSALGLVLHAAVVALRRLLVPWHASVQHDLIRLSG